MKTNKIIAGAMALLVPATLCLTGCDFGVFNVLTYTYDNSEKYTAGDREISDKITTIDIDYVSGDVTLNGSDTDKVTVKETANKDLDDAHKVHTWVDGSTLYVRYCESTKKISFNRIEKKLELNIPGAQDLDNLSIKISSGDFKCDGVTAGKLNANSSSGDVGISCKASDIDLKVSSGDIVLNQEGMGGSVNIKSSSGTVDYTQTGSNDQIIIKSSSGGVKADVEKASSLSIDVSSGAIAIDADDVADLNAKASSGDMNITLGNVPQNSKLDSSSGDIRLNVPENADMTATVKISSGSFDSELPFAKEGKNYTCGNGSSTMDIRVSSGDVDINVI
ncbi:MAG: DUF4097 family beta strand repeat protein [Clostridiales bacterium]|nr:DUF4097 family beta strand repeat protein [Clostridiales bacterium]